MIPHPEKSHKGGEDAFYAHKKLLTVADGVGGWATQGVDPGLYSKEFCRHINQLFNQKQQNYITNPKQLIIDAHGKTNAIGSTTCCIIAIDDEKPVLYSSYIGDSGYAIFRKSIKNEKNSFEIIFKSQEQQRSFNFPYQIGSIGDDPDLSLTFKHEVQHNDLIVMGTDGLFDNIDEKQILKQIEPYWNKSNDQELDLQLIAETITLIAYKLSMNPGYNSPFAQHAKQAGYFFLGGKSDDITVVIGQVKLKSQYKSNSQQKSEDENEEQA